MTENEWLHCADPEQMLGFLEGKVSERKLRLFACACVRSIWHLLAGDSQSAVELSERDADGDLRKAEWKAGLRAAHRARMSQTATRAAQAAHTLLNRRAWRPGGLSSDRPASFYPVARAMDVLADVRATEEVRREMSPFPGRSHPQYARLLREVVGNPFQPVPSLDKAWLAWSGGVGSKMASTIYEERRFEDLPVLADALEEAGCENAEILQHCRQPDLHVRGCWVVDILLDRQ